MIRRLVFASLLATVSGLGTTQVAHGLPGLWPAVIGVLAGCAVWTWAVIA